MKIIAGRLRGRKLKAPKGLATRPVLARVREALFNVLGNIEGARVLDLYAGTGAVGIEALSRGAQSLVAVDRGYRQCRVIRENLSRIGIDAVVIRSSVTTALEKLCDDGSVFDFIFADPPYERGMAQKTVVSVFNKGLLSDSGVMALTVHRSEGLPSEEDKYEMIFDRSYGETRLVIYKIKQ
ncbi:MAG TPA: 16S rRNA (guanine(966)-N(2))-methyltransferase RsmD [Anaerolineae bacterium]|nr:16S rRNA (guanine(966)-N(2))-methyltransferase RsmD [Anaerolineae bacterium]